MAGGSPPLTSAKKKNRRAKHLSKSKAPPRRQKVAEPEPLGSLPRNEAVPDQDPFSLLVGGTEGGFLSLEEIDDVEYGLIAGDATVTVKSKKRKKVSSEDGRSVEEIEPGLVDVGEEEKKVKKKKPRRKKKAEAQVREGGSVEENTEENKPSMSNAEDCVCDAEESSVDDIEFYAWDELRLHPLLMKSIRLLGFKEPTPIQKACIPAAAHQGKDVIGAAETGSGKTLAFGLPILQRLLEEREKAARLLEEKPVNEADQESPLRALIITPTRELALQVTDHLKEAAKLTNVKVVPIVGGIFTEKQERLLKRRPEIVVGTSGRLWELMSGGEKHLAELHSLSFFVLDEADRMIENGHFQELQSIIDMLPNSSVSNASHVSENCQTVPNLQRKKRQTCVFSATIALSDSFRKKLKRGFCKPKPATTDGLSSIESLSERAGMRPDVAIFDLTNASIVAEKLEESFIECTEENKESYLYYILSVHGQGRTIVFCTSIAALRRISSLLRILGVNAWSLHAQMQQRARMKAIDRFRASEHGILVATDVAARGLDIPGVRTVVHYQLPHSAEVYIHRSGRTARAAADGCSIALISPIDRMKFFSLCKSLSKENFLRFPVDDSCMFEILKRISLARQIDKISRKNSQENMKKSWFERNAESIDLQVDESDSEEEIVKKHKQNKISSLQLQKLQQELRAHLSRPIQPGKFSNKFLAGAGVSPVLQQQLEILSKQRLGETTSTDGRRPKFVVIGQDCVEPLQALRTAGHEVSLNSDKRKEMRKLAENWKKKRREAKKSERDQRRKKRKNAKQA